MVYIVFKFLVLAGFFKFYVIYIYIYIYIYMYICMYVTTDGTVSAYWASSV